MPIIGTNPLLQNLNSAITEKYMWMWWIKWVNNICILKARVVIEVRFSNFELIGPIRKIYNNYSIFDTMKKLRLVIYIAEL